MLLENLINIGDGKNSQFRTIWGVVENIDQSKLLVFGSAIYHRQIP